MQKKKEHADWGFLLASGNSKRNEKKIIFSEFEADLAMKVCKSLPGGGERELGGCMLTSLREHFLCPQLHHVSFRLLVLVKSLDHKVRFPP